MRTRLQLEADRRSTELRRSIAAELRRLREDSGITRTAVAVAAGVHPSAVARAEEGTILPTLETYVRLSAALGADFLARPYPSTGPRIRDRHQVRMAELLLGTIHPRWSATPEVPVRRPSRGWVDFVLHDPRADTLVASELESGLRRIEQTLRWSREKADSLPSAREWRRWAVGGEPEISRLLVVRWTRSNREMAASARRLLREAYPADPI